MQCLEKEPSPPISGSHRADRRPQLATCGMNQSCPPTNFALHSSQTRASQSRRVRLPRLRQWRLCFYHWLRDHNDNPSATDLHRARSRETREATGAEGLERMLNVFAMADPFQNFANNVSGTSFLDQAAKSIERELADQPVARARLLQAVGRAHTLGEANSSTQFPTSRKPCECSANRWRRE